VQVSVQVLEQVSVQVMNLLEQELGLESDLATALLVFRQ
jgi:hypothetical protein